jgi:hypothetical protein
MVSAMSVRILPRTLVLLLCIACLASAALAGEASYNPPPSYYYCTSEPAANTRYYSAMFKVPWRGIDYKQMSNSFGQFLAQKYGVKSAAVCFGDPNQAEAQHRVRQTVEQLKMSKWTLVQTKWTYNGAPSEGQAIDDSTSNRPSLPANAAASPKNSIDGDYVGTYTCAKGPTDLKLTLKAPEYGLLTGTFTFYLPPGSHTKAYTFSLNGHFDPKSGSFNLNPLKWETPAPPNYMMVGLKGAVDANAGRVSGVVDYTGCGRFEAMKGRDD